jgi:tRNA (guanine-N7-)-methyltransferase
MKPKDLKNPFPWEERKVLLHDRILYVPEYLDNYNTFLFSGWDHPAYFGNHNPVYVEYCSGNGTWIAEKARLFPEVNWVAVELRFERVKKIWSKIKNLQLKNLLVICGEGHCVTSQYFPVSSVDRIFINYPDPWPKTRHAKHRIIKPSFIAELWRVLKKLGIITMVTDDPDYSQIMRETISLHPGLDSIHPNPYYITHLEGYGSSYFDQLWRGKGKVIHYHQYEKREKAE